MKIKLTILTTALFVTSVGQAKTMTRILPLDAKNIQIESVLKRELPGPYAVELRNCDAWTDTSNCEERIYNRELVYQMTISYDSRQEGRFEENGDQRFWTTKMEIVLNFPEKSLAEVAKAEFLLNKKIRRPGSLNRQWASKYFTLKVKDFHGYVRHEDQSKPIFECAVDSEGYQKDPSCSNLYELKNVLVSDKALFVSTKN